MNTKHAENGDNEKSNLCRQKTQIEAASELQQLEWCQITSLDILSVCVCVCVCVCGAPFLVFLSRFIQVHHFQM